MKIMSLCLGKEELEILEKIYLYVSTYLNKIREDQFECFIQYIKSKIQKTEISLDIKKNQCCVSSDLDIDTVFNELHLLVGKLHIHKEFLEKLEKIKNIKTLIIK